MSGIGIEQARKTLGDLVNQAQYSHTITYLTRNGRPVAAIVPLERIMQTTATYDTTQAAQALMADGFSRGDVLATIDSCISAGLELPQPDDGYRFTEGEIDVMREQLSAFAYIVVIEAGSADGGVWQTVASEIAHASNLEETADDIAAWVAQNQNAATGPGSARVRVWKGADLDVVHARPADAEREIPSAD